MMYIEFYSCIFRKEYEQACVHDIETNLNKSNNPGGSAVKNLPVIQEN